MSCFVAVLSCCTARRHGRLRSGVYDPVSRSLVTLGGKEQVVSSCALPRDLASDLSSGSVFGVWWSGEGVSARSHVGTSGRVCALRVSSQ